MTVTEKECLKAIITLKDYFDENWTYNDCGCYKDGDKISMDTGYFFGGLDNIEEYLIIKLRRSKKMKQAPIIIEADKEVDE